MSSSTEGSNQISLLKSDYRKNFLTYDFVSRGDVRQTLTMQNSIATLINTDQPPLSTGDCSANFYQWWFRSRVRTGYVLQETRENSPDKTQRVVIWFGHPVILTGIHLMGWCAHNFNIFSATDAFEFLCQRSKWAVRRLTLEKIHHSQHWVWAVLPR